MRSGSRRIIVFAASAVMCLLGLAGVAWASTITQPVGATFAVPGDASGNPLPFTVAATGFTPTALVYVEQCDGVDPTTKDWSPTVDCDLGSSPAPAIVDATGKATFLATDVNHAFTPFKGESEQSLFNCLSPTQPSPANGLADFRNCRMRVSTNNNAITADQSFVALTLPELGSGTTTTSTSTTVSTSSSSTSTSTVPSSTSTTSSTVSSTSTTSTTVPAATTTTIDPTTTTTLEGSTTTTAIGGTTTTIGTLGTTVATTPTTVAALAVDAGTGSGTLPRTGGSSMPVAAAGFVLIIAGVGLAVGGRKRVL